MSPLTSCSDLPVRPVPGGVRIAVRLSPRAGSDCIAGIERLADGGTILKVSVIAPPAEQRANAALLQLLAKQWGLKRPAMRLVGGLKNRRKVVHVDGEPEVLLRHLAAVMAALPGP